MIPAVAGELVVEVIAGAVDVGIALQHQIFDIGAEREGGGAADVVGALVGQLDHLIAGVLHHVGVVAGAAGQDVDACVVADRVSERVAGAVDVAGAGQIQVLDIVGQREVNAGGDEIGALARLLDHLVAGAVHVIVIVTGSAQHGVVAGAAVEIVAVEAAIQAIGAGEPVQPVDAGERGDGVVAIGAGERFATVGAGDNRHVTSPYGRPSPRGRGSC